MSTQEKKKKENPLWNIAFNIVVPAILLSKYSNLCARFNFDGIIFPFKLGESVNQIGANGLVLALLFPAAYFFYDLAVRKKRNFISILGFFGILLTGVVGIFQLPSFWIAVKDTTIPLALGITVLVSLKTKFPLVKKVFYNDEIIDVERVETALAEKDAHSDFDRLFVVSTYWMFLSFLISAVLHYFVAVHFLKSPIPTNEELGQLITWKYPLIVLPLTLVMLGIVLFIFNKISKLTGLKMEEIFKIEEK
jgi:hypothetical protein